MEKKKHNIIILSCLALLFIAILGVSYAYYVANVDGNLAKTPSMALKSGYLKIEYTDGAEFKPTESDGTIIQDRAYTKTFTVTNSGIKGTYYSVWLKDVKNPFERTQDWTYTLSVGTDEIISSTVFPTSDKEILPSRYIDVGESETLTLSVTYASSSENQIVDMNKTLEFNISVAQSISEWEKASVGTLLYAIKRDNVVSEPLSVPGKSPSGIISYSEGELSEETESYSVDSTYQNYYFIYGTGYTFDEESGTYTLTGVTTTTDTYASSYSELEGKYIAKNGSSNWNIAVGNKQNAKTKKTSGLLNINKITSATSSSYTFQTLSESTPSYETEALLASTEDDYGTSYYYRGAVENNYVNYSGMCWRIVRVQGNGTIKLALADENGECDADTYSTSNTTSAFVDGRTNIKYKSDVLYNATDFPFENSDIPSVLSGWATKSVQRNGVEVTNLDTSKLVEAEWCNDTAKTSAYGSVLYYGSFDRLSNLSKANPTLKCNKKGIDGSTGTEANAQKYKNILGILSADEVAFAGAAKYISEAIYDYYLKTNSGGYFYWTLSPAYLYSVDLFSTVYGVYSAGGLVTYTVDMEGGYVRPAVVLASDVTISSGNGTVDNPYIVN